MTERIDQPVRTADGANANLVLVLPSQPRAGLLWVPAMGVSARHYLPLAESLAANGIAVALHELRGTGSSDVRASRRSDWGYRELLEHDLPASRGSALAHAPDVPWYVGGHSLGAQLAALHAAADPGSVAGLVIVASGSPYWREFPRWQRPIVRFVFTYFRALAALAGYFPGRRVGFAGNEARSVVRDWAESGITGVYRPRGVALDFEQALARYPGRVLGIRLAHDRYVTPAALQYLLDKLGAAPCSSLELAPAAFPSGKATHFSWMKEPGPVAAAIAAWMRP